MNALLSADLNKNQVLALVANMLSTAQIDGITPQELKLISDFYANCGVAELPSFEEVKHLAEESNTLLAGIASNAAFSEQLVLLCFMTAYADGHLSDAEKNHVTEIARKLGLADTHIDELLLYVKDSLLGSLSHLPDAESVAALAKSL